MATVVGIFTRVAGVWERVNAGTPEGFAGPHVYQSGAWENTVVDYVNITTVWLPCWVNIDGELNFLDLTSTDFDLSPYNTSSLIDVNGDGTLDKKSFGSTQNGIANWRTYDCGREYEIMWSHDAFDNANVEEPTLDTWLNLTDPSTTSSIIGSHSGTGFLFFKAHYLVRIREKVSAPAGGNDLAFLKLQEDAEI